MCKRTAFCLGICLILTAAPAIAETTFEGLGFNGIPWDISSDGSVVVGNDPMTNSRGWRWSTGSGTTWLNPLPGDLNAAAWGVSDDGQMIAGVSHYNPPPGSDRFEAVVWQGASPTPLGWLPGATIDFSTAYDVSNDTGSGRYVAGTSHSDTGYQAYRKLLGAPMQALGSYDSPTPQPQMDMSSDGTVIAGTRSQAAYRWTESSGSWQWLGFLGGDFKSYAMGVSGDGSTVVGGATNNSFMDQAFRWTESGGMVSLGGNSAWDSYAEDVSEDGALVVGTQWDTLTFEPHPFIWDAYNGLRDLATVLTGDYGLDLEDWHLGYNVRISADGTTLIGQGVNPDMQTEVWRAVIPEPATLWLLALPLVMMRRRS